MTDREIPQEESRPKGRRTAAGRALILFLLVMAALTVANRALNELSTPIVTEAKAQRGALEKRIDADGQVKAATETPVFAPVKARVGAVHVRSGQRVKKGDPLFTLDPEALKELKDTAQNELSKLKNDREKAAGSADGAPHDAAVREAETAHSRAKAALEAKKAEQDQAVDSKQAQLVKAEARVAQAKSAYEAALEDAWRAYLKDALDKRDEKAKALTEKRQAFAWATADVSRWTMNKYQEFVKDVVEAQASSDASKRELENAQAALEAAKGTEGFAEANAALKKAQRKAKEEKKDLDGAIHRRDALSGIRDYLKALRELDAARSEDSAAEAGYQAAAANAPEVVRAVERKVSSDKSELSSAETELDEKTAALETAMYDRDKAVSDAEKAVEEAEAALRKAESEWHGQALDAANNDAAILQKQAELERIEEAAAADGVVAAPYSGQVASCDMKPGKVASPDEAGLTISRPGDGLEVWIPVSEEEAGLVKAGDTAEISLGGDLYECKILSIAPSADDKGKYDLLFQLPGGAGQPGMTASMAIKKRTKNYETIVPLSALRKDDMGYFVYALTESDGALGTETRVKRANVQVLDKDSTRAAVSGGVAGRDRLAARSDRELHDGDRVNVE